MYKDGAVSGATCIENGHHAILLEPYDRNAGLFKVYYLSGTSIGLDSCLVGISYNFKQKFYKPMFLTNVLFGIEGE